MFGCVQPSAQQESEYRLCEVLRPERTTDCQSLENVGFLGLLCYSVCRLLARMTSNCASTASRISGSLIVPE